MSLYFEQLKPLKIKILGIVIFPLIGYILFKEIGSIFQIIFLLVISVILLLYKIRYEVMVGGYVYKHFGFLNITVYKRKMDISYPEYISVFSASFKQDNEWGSVSALGTQERHEKIVIRFFNGTEKFTLYKTNNYTIALKKAKELGELLDVEIHNAIRP